MPRSRRKRWSRSILKHPAAFAAAGAVAAGVVAYALWPDGHALPAPTPTELPGGKLAAVEEEPPAVEAVTPPPTTTAAADPRPGGLLDPALLAKADDLIARDELLAARKLLAERLQAGDLTGPDADPLKARLAGIADVVTFSPRPFAGDPHQATLTVPPGGTLGKLARPHDVPWQAIARVNGINPRGIRAGQTLKTPAGPFHAVVDKGAFTLDLYLGDPAGPDGVYLRTYDVGLGEDASTPTGLWRVRPGGKLEDPTWTNPRTGEVVAGNDPENPLGERWIALDGVEGNAVGQQSYGIHGTIEPETIGTNASMGCVRLLPDDVAEVYDYLQPGKSTVRVVE